MTHWGATLARAFPEGRWRGRWIWAGGVDEETRSSRTVVALRRDVHLDAVAASVPARMLAVARYVMFVNGDEVARGPVRANPRRQPYDVIDLAPHLRPGPNALAVLAWRYGNPMPWWAPPPVRNDLPLGAFVLEAYLGDDWLITDGAWTGCGLPTWSSTPPEGVPGRGRETLDASTLPPDWLCPAGGASWAPAIERQASMPADPRRPEPPGYPLGPVEPRPIPWPTVKPVPLTSVGKEVWAAGELHAGTVRVECEGPADAMISVQVAERTDASGVPRPTADDAGFDVVCDGSRRVIETLECYGLSGVLVSPTSGARVHGVQVVERLHPVAGDAFFRCSDERLNQIWSVGRRTVSLCSWDAYIDCPTRELRAWTGDAVVHQMVDLTTNEDWSLATWYARLSASPRADGMIPMAVGGEIEHGDTMIIADWALHWVHGVWNLYRYMGDRNEVAGLLPVVEGVLRWFERFCGADGLPASVNGAVLIDWSSVYVDDASSALAGLWGRALLEFAEISDWLGDRGRAAWSRETHARLAAGFERFWDASRGRYADAISQGELLPMASQHGQAAALVGGLVPRARWERLVEVLTDEENLVYAAFNEPDGPALPNAELGGGTFLATGRPRPWWDVDRQVVRAQPFFRYVVHDALVAAGRSDLIAAACLDWAIALERCPTSWTETWWGGTICHGWSATPTRDLVTCVLGVRPADPGFHAATVEPALGHLAWASGAVPTPKGMLRVDVNATRVVVDAPLPFVHRGLRYEPGRHEIDQEERTEGSR